MTHGYAVDNYTWNDLPEAECPHCEEKFQLDEYYEYEECDSFFCPKCEKEIFILLKDVRTHAKLGKTLGA